MTRESKNMNATELALKEVKADLAAGRFVRESAAAHVRRLKNAKADGSWDEWFDSESPSADFISNRE